jgi:hypothetical protein
MRGFVTTLFAFVLASLLVLNVSAAGPYGKFYPSGTTTIKHKVSDQTNTVNGIQEIAPDGNDVVVSFFITNDGGTTYRNIMFLSDGTTINPAYGDADTVITVGDGQVLRADLRCDLILVKRASSSAVQINHYR